MNRTIVVVGSINLDLVCTGAKIPSPGETVWGDRFQTFHGGKGANQAVAAGRLGASVFMVGKVGDDEFGGELRRGLQDDSVNVENVAIEAGVSSGVALITVDRKAQNSITVVAGANGKLLPKDLDACKSRIQSAGIVLVQLEVPLETVLCLSEIADAAGVPLMLDPAPAPAAPLPRELLRRITYLTPNETEACILCGLPTETELGSAEAGNVADRLLAGGVANVILKLGHKGVFLAGQDGTRRVIPAFEVNALDTTAAGDAFNGGLAAGLMQGLELAQAVEFGAAVAAVSVTRAGAQPAMPTLAEVASAVATPRPGCDCAALLF